MNLDTALLANFLKDQGGWLDSSQKDLSTTQIKFAVEPKKTPDYNLKPEDTNGKVPLQVSGNGTFGVLRHKDAHNTTPKPKDFKEVLQNNVWLRDYEVEVYNDDEIPFHTYQAMSYDTKIALATDLICGFISRLNYSIESPDPEIKALVMASLKPHYTTLVRQMVKESFKYGWLMAEKVWERKQITIKDKADPNTKKRKDIFKGWAVIPKKIKVLDPRQAWSYYINPKNDELLRIEQHQSVGIVSVPRTKLVWFALDQEYSNIFGRSRYKRAYQAWFYHIAVKQAMLQKLDKTGDPPVGVRFPDGFTMVSGTKVPNDVIADRLLANVTNDKGFVMPSTRDEQGHLLWDVAYVEIKNDELEGYEEVLDRLDKEKVEGIGLFGNILAGKANYAELDAKEDLLMVLIEDVVDQIEKCIQIDLIDYIVSYNFGPDEIIETNFRMDRNSLGRTKHLKEVLKECLRILASDPSIDAKYFPDIYQMSRDLGIPISTYSENTVRKEEADLKLEGMKEDNLNKKQKREEPPQPNKNPEDEGAQPDLIKDKQRDEDSNGRDRKTPDERERERKNKRNITE
jgi:hypothetical protein